MPTERSIGWTRRGASLSKWPLPVLGGDESVANLEPTDVSVHFGVLGQIHEQVKDLPPGTEIGEIRLE